LDAESRIGTEDRRGHLVACKKIERHEPSVSRDTKGCLPGKEVDYLRGWISVDAAEAERSVVGGDTGSQEQQVNQVKHNPPAKVSTVRSRKSESQPASLNERRLFAINYSPNISLGPAAFGALFWIN
jgi:hypothetical protein